MGTLKECERILLEREVGELCPNLKFQRFYKPKSRGTWQIDTEDHLKFQCPAQSGKVPEECKKYQSYCAYLLTSNELLKGFDSVY